MKWKRPLAIIGLVLILSIYAAALIAAFSRNPNAKNWLMAAIFSSVIVPVIIYAAQLAYKVLKPEDKNKKQKNNS